MQHVTRRATFRSTGHTFGAIKLSRRLTTKHHDPLNILFCGADNFSIHSLLALHKLHQTKPKVINSISVVCRPDKRVGRGLKHLRQVPIKPIAEELHLPLHQLDTFTSWSPPSAVNLIVAVSFGLLVPSRLLTAAKYGGLNIHPSLLPDLRGPDPITHALLKRRSHTGVTLQTMHPTKFDHGTILAQTLPPGVPVPKDCTTAELLEILGPMGAELLCYAIEDGTFLDPIDEFSSSAAASETVEYAPKIGPEGRRIDWSSWSAGDVVLRDRVLTRLWDMQIYAQCFPMAEAKRVLFHGPWTIVENVDAPTTPGEPVIDREAGVVFGVSTVDGKVVVPESATIEGGARQKGLETLTAGLMNSTQQKHTP